MTSSSSWLFFALSTVCCWGLYGILLHSGVMGFDPKTDPDARYKAFFFVGIAYFLTAVLAPVALLALKGTDWSTLANGPAAGWSLAAGIVGALGAFFVLRAFGAGGQPAVVMSIIFAGAPIVNAMVSMALHPPAGGLTSIDPRFWAGVLMAASGGLLVSLFKPH